MTHPVAMRFAISADDLARMRAQLLFEGEDAGAS